MSEHKQQQQKKRRVGGGSVIRRADGSYEARAWVQPPPGSDAPAKRVARRARTKAEAEAKLRELTRAAAIPTEAERLRVASRLTVAAFVPRWEAIMRAEVADGRLRERGVTDNLAMLRRYAPEWENKILSSLRASDAAAVNARMARRGLSSNTRRLAMLALRRLLAAAASDGLVAPSVPGQITIPKVRDAGVRPTPTPDQAHALLAALTADLDRHPAALLGLLALGTGARRGELCGAMWADLTRADGRVLWTVARSVTVAERELYLNPPKGGQAREVPLPSYLVEALDAARRRAPFRLYLAESDARPGEPTHPDALGAYFRKIAAEAGLPAELHGWHAVRRYVGTELANGVDLDTAAYVLGHKDISVTRRFYLARRGERVVNGLDAIAGRLTS